MYYSLEEMMKEDEHKPGEGGGIFVHCAIMVVLYTLIFYVMARV